MQSPAAGLFAFEFNESEETEAGIFESPLGVEFSSVNIAGAVTAAWVSPSTGRISARVSDPTGVYLIDAGRKNTPAARLLSGAAVPSLVSVTGEAFCREKMYVRARAAVQITHGMRDSWIKAVAGDTIGRMERAHDNSGESVDLAPYIDAVERALGVLRDSPGDDDMSCSGIVLSVLGACDGGRGMPVADLVRECTSKGFGEPEVKRAIESLVEEGECYLPSGGYIRRL